MAQRHNRNANPPVIKPIRVLVIHPSVFAFLLSFSPGILPSVDTGVQKLYSVVVNSVGGVNEGNEVFSVLSLLVGDCDDNEEDVLTGG